jgi:hypothetical protein
MTFAGTFIVGPCTITGISTCPAVPAICFIRTDDAVHTFLMFLALVVLRASTQYLWLARLEEVVVGLLWVLQELEK